MKRVGRRERKWGGRIKKFINLPALFADVPILKLYLVHRMDKTSSPYLKAVELALIVKIPAEKQKFEENLCLL